MLKITQNPESLCLLEIHDPTQTAHNTWNDISIIPCRQRVNIYWGVLSMEDLNVVNIGGIMENYSFPVTMKKFPGENKLLLNKQRQRGRDARHVTVENIQRCEWEDWEKAN